MGCHCVSSRDNSGYLNRLGDECLLWTYPRTETQGKLLFNKPIIFLVLQSEPLPVLIPEMSNPQHSIAKSPNMVLPFSPPADCAILLMPLWRNSTFSSLTSSAFFVLFLRHKELQSDLQNPWVQRKDGKVHRRHTHSRTNSLASATPACPLEWE